MGMAGPSGGIMSERHLQGQELSGREEGAGRIVKARIYPDQAEAGLPGGSVLSPEKAVWEREG